MPETKIPKTPVKLSVVSFVVASTALLPCGTVAAGELRMAQSSESSAPLVVEGMSNFAFDLYRQLANEDSDANICCSPFSISSALLMTAEGARGETSREMGAVLRFPEQTSRQREDAGWIPWETALLHSSMASLNRHLNRQKEEHETARILSRIAELRTNLEVARNQTAQLLDAREWEAVEEARAREQSIVDHLNEQLSRIDQYEIRVANALWGEKTYPFRSEFVDVISRYYETEGLITVDFRTGFEAARQRINAWVAHETNDRIQDLIPPDALDEYTRLVLTNAIYFKGQWSEPFDAEQTEEEDFTLASGKTVQTPLMRKFSHDDARYAAFHGDGSFFTTPRMIARGQDEGIYPDAAGFAVVELPYKGGELSMVLIVPNDAAGLPELEDRLTAAALNAWMGQLEKRETHVYLPKFKLETTYTLGSGGMKPSGTLSRMGMVRAFTDPREAGQGAQFDGMVDSADPRDRLYISSVIHKAFLEVNEKGTEAAAATAVIMATATGLPTTVPFTPTFKADRPFVYLIRDRSTGSILFLGRVTKP